MSLTPLVLHIETTTTNCSVALSCKDQLIAVKEDYESTYSHGERLHIYIDKLLKQEGFKPKDLDAIAVSKGPGSYTGLRIGIATAKGLCYALDIPLISIDTLSHLAKKSHTDTGIVIPMMDARRMEVYTAIYDGTNFKKLKPSWAEILSPESYLDFRNKYSKITFIGNGVAKFESLLSNITDKKTLEQYNFLKQVLPSSQYMVDFAYQKFQNTDFENLTYFEPFYLKDFKLK